MIVDVISVSALTGKMTTEKNEVEEINESIQSPELTIEEKLKLLQDENENIKKVNKNQDALIDTTMLATDEMFSILEPFLQK